MGGGAQALRAILAAVHAGRGRSSTGSDAERAVLRAGATHMLAYVQVARGLTALGEGQYANAYDVIASNLRSGRSGAPRSCLAAGISVSLPRPLRAADI